MITLRRIIFGFFILFFLSSLTKNFFEYRKNIAFYEQYKVEYEAEKKRNNELKTQLVKNSDSFEMEKRIRNKLNLLKDGETAILLPEPTPTPTVVIPTPMPPQAQWAEVFFGE